MNVANPAKFRDTKLWTGLTQKVTGSDKYTQSQRYGRMEGNTGTNQPYVPIYDGPTVVGKSITTERPGNDPAHLRKQNNWNKY